MDIIELCKTKMSENGFPIPENLHVGNEYHRFSISGSDNSGYCKLSQTFGVFGDFRTDEKYYFTLYNKNITSTEKKKINREIDNEKKKNLKEKKLKNKKAEVKANNIWNNINYAEGEHDYLITKKVKPYDIGIQGEKLVIPAYNNNEEIKALQYIRTDGQKRFLTGSSKAGHYFTIKGRNDIIYITEGYATGATIHEATNQTVIIAFDSGNILPVAKNIRTKFNNTEIIICADNDRFNKINIGVEKATKASLEIKSKLIIPQFKNDSHKGTDFNDLFIEEGLDVVVSQLTSKENEIDTESLLQTINIPDHIKDYVFVKEHNLYYNKNTLTAILPAAFDQAYPDTENQTPTGITFIKPTKAFKKHNGICVDTIDYKPVEYGAEVSSIGTKSNGATFLNRYTPPIIIPTSGSVKSFTDLAKFLIPDNKIRELVFDWMAFTLRFPNKKINWQILFIGSPRIGKDALSHPLYKIMGASSGEASNSELGEPYSDYLADTKFLVIQEIYHPNDKSIQAKIKVYTASTAGNVLRVNPKSCKKFVMPNLLSVMAFSNHANALQMDEGDKRFLVINSQVEPKDDKYYKNYFKWLEQEQGIEKVMSFFLKRDIQNFNYGALPFKTNAYKALVKEGQPLWIQDLEISLENKEAPFNKDTITIKQVSSFINKNNNKYKVSDKTISDLLINLGFKKLKQGMRKITNKQNGTNKTCSTPRLWARGDLFDELNKKTASGIFNYYFENDISFKKSIIREFPEFKIKK